MPPKKGAKKGKKGNDDDDAYWEAKAAALESQSPMNELADDAPAKRSAKASKPAFSSFDALGDDIEDDDEDEGGLMATIRASASKKKDKKAKKKAAAFAELDEDMNENGEAEPAAAPAEKPQVDTTVNLDDEWPEEEVKPKKGKAGKKAKGGKKGAAKDDDDDESWYNAPPKAEEEKKAAVVEEPAALAKEAPAPAAHEDDEEDDGPKILTKAQKEKLKKEKEKAKKKAQAAAKKQQAGVEPQAAAEPTPAPATAETVGGEAEDDDEDEGGAAGGDKKKKKKKKAAAKAEPAAPAPSKGGKKVSAAILAMQAAMEEKKRVEEELRKAEEERIRLIEEEEARIAAEEAKAAELKSQKKQKEKEKIAKAKAEGRFLTPKQKAEKAAAEARKQAMLASGMIVAGLQDGEAKKPKPTYGKKKPAAAAQAKKEEAAAPAPEAPKEQSKAESEPSKPEAPKAAATAVAADDDEDDWDKSEDDEAAVEEVVAGMDKMTVEEDDWDQSEDEKPAAAPAPKVDAKAASATSAKAKPAAAATAAASKPAVAAPASAKTNGKAAPAKPEPESDDDEDSDEDSDDSDDDSDEDESTEYDSDEDEDEIDRLKAVKRGKNKVEQRQEAAAAASSKDDMRSPICCILGHVDTGKTKLLDKIRQTSVQAGEAGGITQQIGATFFPKEALVEKTAVVNSESYDFKIPGLLIIDTPGHESFSNLRSRGSSLCNIAILVINFVKGLEQQTLESIQLLKKGRTPFIVALNQVDRVLDWKSVPNGGFRETLNAQTKQVRSRFDGYLEKAKLALAEQGFNSELFDENKSLGRTISLVPTSAITGEGIPDMLMLLVKLTQERMNSQLMYISSLECTILEVKVVEGHGTTIDVILSNGIMRESDKIVLCGMDGPIVTTVRALLTPQPMRELRVKSAYVHHKECKAALGVKISAPGLEKAIAGARLYVAKDDDEVEYFKEMAMQDLTDLERFAARSGRGVWVQASTLGSLEALLTFLQQMDIPVYSFGIGPIHTNVIRKTTLMLRKAPEYAVVLAFDVELTKEATEAAKDEGIQVFESQVIYHLFDAFKKYMGEVNENKRKDAMPNAVWPCRLKIIKAFANRDPIVLGVDIAEGATLRTGTPVGVVKKNAEGKREIVRLGKITSIELNHKPHDVVKKTQIGQGAAIKIERAPHEQPKMYGRHFDDKDELVSLISRQSLDTLKENFRKEVDMSDWALLKKMKEEQGVQ